MQNSLDNELLELCRQDKKLEAIKLYKEATGMGLKESKDYVESLMETGITGLKERKDTDDPIVQVYNKNVKESKEYEDNIDKNKGLRSHKKEGGCFIATACYGDCNSSEVVILRKFRDNKLLGTYCGAIFVKIYYFISPFIARQLDKSEKAKRMVRKFFLEPIIRMISHEK